MRPVPLAFEHEVAEIEEQIDHLRRNSQENQASEVLTQIGGLEKKRDKILKRLYGRLDAAQTILVARHPDRPQTLDLISYLFTDFVALHGDRMYSDDAAIVGGPARFKASSVMVIGHQKGHTTEERVARNFGMPMPEGYRKALRLMRLAERFSLPLLTLVDTAGAYPGIEAEQRMQAHAIGANLLALASLRTPIITMVIGEGGSGGALGLGVADRVLMMEHAFYSVISPEGCSSILFRTKDRQQEAATALKITAADLKKLGLVDDVVAEPLGGAHRNPAVAAKELGRVLDEALAQQEKVNIDKLVALRAQRLRSYGKYSERG